MVASQFAEGLEGCYLRKRELVAPLYGDKDATALVFPNPISVLEGDRLAHEERATDTRLQLFDLMGQCGLRQEHSIGRLHQAPRVAQGHQCAKMS